MADPGCGAGGFAVVEASGEIDAYTSTALGERLTAAVDDVAASAGGAGGSDPRSCDAAAVGGASDEATGVIADLRGATFIDSTGLGVLVGGANRARGAGCALRVVCDVERVLKLLRITGLHAVLDVYPTVEEAVAGAGSGAGGSDGKAIDPPAGSTASARSAGTAD